MHHTQEMNANLKASLRSAAKQRTLEIATIGFSDITLPKKRSKRLNGKAYVAAKMLLLKALEEAQATRHSIEVKIQHDSRMAEGRLEKCNYRSACSSMKKVIAAQFGYIDIQKRIAAVTALNYNLDNNLVRTQDVEENLNEILWIPEVEKATHDEHEVLELLENRYFFPILDTETGTLSFTESFDYASSFDVASRPDKMSKSDQPTVYL